MQKIPTLFQRNYDGDHLVRNEVNPAAQWVLDGEGTPTRKYDGTCCMTRDGVLYKRYELKCGKTAPEGFEAAQSDADPVTGETPGWVPVGDGPEDHWHREAFGGFFSQLYPIYMDQRRRSEPTYELVGPKIGKNAEKAEAHMLFAHGAEQLYGVPRDYEGLRQYLADHALEGIVWHHRDGRACKIKRRDYGLPWPVKE